MVSQSNIFEKYHFDLDDLECDLKLGLTYKSTVIPNHVTFIYNIEAFPNNSLGNSINILSRSFQTALMKSISAPG